MPIAVAPTAGGRIIGRALGRAPRGAARGWRESLGRSVGGHDTMGSIHATMNLSVDGCCDHSCVIADDEFHERISDVFEPYSALLFGRTTYDLLHDYWPNVAPGGDATPGALRLARILDAKTKWVVTSRALAPDWRARPVAAQPEALRALRDEVDGNVLLVASPTLARTLLQRGLVSEYHIVVSPMVAGHGPRFLEGLQEAVLPALLDVIRLRSGVLVLRYRVGAQRDAA